MLGLWDCWNPRFQRFHGPNAAGEGPALTWVFSCAAAARPGSIGRCANAWVRAMFPRACAAGPCSRCTRARLPVAPGAAVDCLAGLRVCRVVRCLCAERPPLRRPTRPHITFSARTPGEGAQGGRRACGRGGGPGDAALPLDPWAGVPKTPGPQRGAPASIHCGCCLRRPGRTSENRSKAAATAPDWRQSDFAAALFRLPRREGARADAPTSKGRRKIRRLLSFAIYRSLNRCPLLCCWSAPAYGKLVPTLTAYVRLFPLAR